MFYPPSAILFFFNDTATTEIYTLSLHDALPIYSVLSATPRRLVGDHAVNTGACEHRGEHREQRDRKSTRLNSSHRCISYAVFCLKKKKKANKYKSKQRHRPHVQSSAERSQEAQT